MKTLVDIARILYAELRNVMRDHGVILFIVIVPLLYPLLYAYIYNNEVVREVPIAIVDEANTPLSRQFVRMLDATPEVRVSERCRSVEQARELNRRAEIYGIVVIPADFEQRLNNGEQATIGVYADMAGMLYYKAALLAATNVSLAMNKQIQVERFYVGATERQEEIATQPIGYYYVPLYNPQSGFAAFLMPPVLMLILQQTLMLGIGMTGGGVRERFGNYAVPTGRLYRNPFNIVAGRTLFYFILYVLLAVYMYVVVTRMFGLPQLGRWYTYLAFIVPFLLASIFMAITFSAFVYRREDCILLFVFMSVPLLFISGISWPGSAVPDLWRWVGCLFPSTFATNGYARINSMGAVLADVRTEFVALWIQAGVYFICSVVFYRHEILRRLKRKGR